MSEHERQWFFIIYELQTGGSHADEQIYDIVHREGGYHYRRDDADGWERLPRRTVALPLLATNPQLARVAFELKLAHLDLMPASIVVVTGNSDVQMRPVAAALVPAYAKSPAANRPAPAILSAAG